MLKKLIIALGCLVAVGLVVGVLLWSMPPSFVNQSNAAENAGVAAPQGPLPPGDRNKGPAPQVGVFYFPGWRATATMAPSDNPWTRIKPYEEREPLISWYHEGEVEVMQKQIDWMAGAGITFVAFDWYIRPNNEVFIDHALNAYLKAPNRSKLKFTLLWANHDKSPDSMENFDAMLDIWFTRYMSQPEMLTIDGKPVVFIFSPYEFEKDARGFRSSTAALLRHAQARAKAKGLPGIYFVACITSDEDIGKDTVKPESGFSAISAYNLHWKPGASHPTHSFKELDEAYQVHWQRYRTLLSSAPLIVPMMSGWDRRPWGGSTDDPKHDDSVSTPDEFEAHLRSGLEEIYKSPAGQPRMGVICCWNEYGEGSFIEPTKRLGTAMIDRVRKVFGPEPVKTN